MCQYNPALKVLLLTRVGSLRLQANIASIGKQRNWGNWLLVLCRRLLVLSNSAKSLEGFEAI